MSKSDYLENKLLDHVLGGGDYTRPSTVYIALYTTSPGESSAGVEVSTSGTGYARAAVVNNATNWPAAAGGSKSNGQAITFAAPTGAWGTIVAWAIVDTASGAANILYYGPLATATSPLSGDFAPSFAAGALVITES